MAFSLPPHHHTVIQMPRNGVAGVHRLNNSNLIVATRRASLSLGNTK